MKLAVVVPHFLPRFAGGVERVALAHARAARASGHDVRIVAGTDDARGADDVERDCIDGLAVAFVPRCAGESFDLALERPRVRDLVLAETDGADVVHVHHWSTLSSDIVRALARRSPVVLSLHDHFASCPRSFRSPPAHVADCPPAESLEDCARCVAPELPGRSIVELDLELVRRSSSFQAEVAAATRVVVPTRTHLVRLAEHLTFAPGQACIVPPGPCLDLPERRQRPRPWRGKGPLRILHFGRRSEEKGTLDLVRALEPLPPGMVELVCLGGSASAAFDRSLLRAAGSLTVELAGPYDGAALAAVASTCHLAAFPSRLPESYSLVVDEALVLGLPAWITFGSVALERWAPEALELLPAGEPELWTEAFERVLASPAESERAFRSLSTSPIGGTPAGERMVRLYEELVGQSVVPRDDAATPTDDAA